MARRRNPTDIVAPTVTTITYGTNDGTLKAGDTVTFSITMSEIVTVSGTPTLALANGGTASYTGGSGTSTLTFSYTVAAGQDTTDLATAASNALTGTILDAGRNAVVASGFNAINPSGILVVDTTAPTVSITDDAATTVSGDVTYTLTFSESVTGLDASDFTVTNGTVSSVTGSGDSYTVIVTPSAGVEGNLELALAAAAVTDTAGNANAASSAASQAIDTLAPTVWITDDAATTVSGDVTYTLTFSESVTGLDASDFTVTNGTVSSVTGSGDSYTVIVTPSAGVEGNLELALAAGAVTDTAGNANAASSAAGQAIDTLAPTVSITDDAATTVSGDVTYTLTFSESVTGLDASDFAVTNGTVSSVTGSGDSYTVIVTPSAGVEGNLDLALAAAAVTDSLGNAAAAASATAQAIDTLNPTLSSIDYGTNDGTLKAGDTVTFSITMSEIVTVSGTPTLALANGGTASYTGGSGTSTLTFSYTVAAGQDTTDLATAASNALTGTISDIVGNAVTASGFDAVNPTGTLVVDTVAPTISTFSPSDGATGVSVSTNIVLSLSEAAYRGTGTITLRSGSASGTIIETFDAATSSRLALSGSNLTIDPTNALVGGTTYFVVIAAGALTDAAGNAHTGTSTYDFTTLPAPNLINGTSLANTLVGTSGIDEIYGLGGNDVLTGAGALDIIDGGEGADIYIIANAADHTGAEFSDTGTSGIDEARFTSSTAGSTLTLYAGDTGLERAVIGTGTSATATTSGTTALNVNASAVTTGMTLVGNAGANTLTAGSGNDILQGGLGNDTLTGGSGFDYADYSTATSAITVNLSLSTLQVTGGAGSDILSQIEGLFGGSAGDTLTGSGSDDALVGNAGADTLIGGVGNDLLNGGNGNDVMTGGGGSDLFLFDLAANTSTNRDTITDFLSGTDRLQFSKSAFAGLTIGDLTADAFRSGAGITTTADATDRLIYNTTTGILYYDADGSGRGAAVQVALLGTTTHPTLVFSDISIV